MPDAENPYRSPLQVKTGSTANLQFSLFRFVTGTPIGFSVAVFPAVLMLFLFYSLAIHMFLSLGAWPTPIGVRGFTSPLVTHARFAQIWFSILLLSCFAWPGAFLVCAVVNRWQFLIKYLIAFAVSCVVCAIIMSFAPSQFLYWWWD